MLDRTEITDLLKSIYLFKKCSPEQVEMAADLFKVWEYEKGEVVFQQGKPAANFYLVFSGQVELIQMDDKGAHQKGVRGSGDVFGFEMLEYESKNLTTAVTKTSTTLLWLDREQMRELLQNIATLNQDLKLLFESYLLSLRIRFPWLDDNEFIIFLSRRHWFNLLQRVLLPVLWSIASLALFTYLVFKFPGRLTPMLLLGADMIVCLAWLLWSYVDWSNDYSILTNRRLVFQERVVMLYHSRQEAPLNAVLSVATETDWFGRQLSFGNVIARTFTGEILLPKLTLPRQVQTLIEVQVQRIRSGLVEEERSRMDDVIREKIGLSQPTEKQEAEKVEREVKSGKLLQWLSGLFRLRLQRGDVTTYWKHWFILMKRISLPSVTLLLLLAVIIARVLNLFTFFSLPTVILFIFVLGLIAGGWWLYNFVDWRNDHYVITSNQIIDVYKKPLGIEERRAAPLKNILSITFERIGILGLILNFGTVYINVGEATLTFDYVFNPSEVQRELFNRLAARDYNEKLQERMDSQKNVADMIEAYHRVTESQRRDLNIPPVEED
jgi:hypothetical protein